MTPFSSPEGVPVTLGMQVETLCDGVTCRFRAFARPPLWRAHSRICTATSASPASAPPAQAFAVQCLLARVPQQVAGQSDRELDARSLQ